MENRNITGSQLGAWLFTAMSAPLAQFAGAISWPVVLLTGAVCLAAAGIVSRIVLKQGRALLVLQYIWILCILGAMVRWIAGSWPSGNVYPAVPLVLVALAAVSASGGERPAAGAASVLFWLVVMVFAVVLVAGIREIDITMLSKAEGTPGGILVVVYLLPAAAAFLPGAEKKLTPRWLSSTLVFGTVVSAMIAGLVSPVVAQSADSPLYQWVRGLGIFGTLERFEAIVAVAVTVGWFSALSYLLCVAGCQAERYKSGWYKHGVWVCAIVTGAGMLAERWINATALAVGCGIMWLAVPIGQQLQVKINYRKFKNNA